MCQRSHVSIKEVIGIVNGRPLAKQTLKPKMSFNQTNNSGMTDPLSSTNRASQILSLRLSSLRPQRDEGSTSSKPSNESAFRADMQSDLGMLSKFPSWDPLGDGMMSLFKDKSIATVNAMAKYAQVSSSAQCFPGVIQGTFTMKASTISGDRLRFTITRCAKFLQCAESLFDSAAVDGRKRADAAKIEVKRKAERDRTKATVCTFGSRPHLVWDKFW